MIIKKKDLTKEEKGIYDGLARDPNFHKKIVRFSEHQKINMIKPVKAYMYNMYFGGWHNYSLDKDRKNLYSFIKWYFDAGLIDEELQREVVRIGQHYSSIEGSQSKYNFLTEEFIINNFDYIVNTDPFGFLNLGIARADKKIIMRVLKRKPSLFYRLRASNHKEIIGNLDRTFSPRFINKALRMVTLESSRRTNTTYFRIPKLMYTQTFCERLVTNVGGNLRMIPAEFITERIATLAVTKAGTALRHVPTEIRTDAICAAALKNSPTALRYMSGKEQKSGLVLRAMLKNKNAKKYLKKDTAAGTK